MKKKIISLLTMFVMVVGLVGVMPTVSVWASNGLVWPVPGHTSLSRGYHSGYCIDISDSSIAGANVVAAKSGTVYAKYTCGVQHYGDKHTCDGFGTGIIIKGDDGRYYGYAHMQANSIPTSVYKGAYVSAGSKIGQVGKTGNATGYHLHFYCGTSAWKGNIQISTSASDYNGSTPTPPSVSFKNGCCCDGGGPGETAATLYIEAYVSNGSKEDFGFRWRKNSSSWASVNSSSIKDEGPYGSGRYWTYWVTGLTSGTKYECQGFVKVNGQTYYSSSFYVTTAGNPPHTHSYTSKVIAPTCTSQGYTLHTCSCGNSYKDNYKNAISHSYIDSEVKPTSTKDKGYTTHTCKNCGYIYKDNYVELKSDGYYYASKLPSWANNNDYAVEYKSHSEKIATSSPGSGWVNAGVYKTEYQNVGSSYENYHYELPTSNERVLVGTMYYHFCGPNAETKVNYDLSGNYVHWDSVDGSRVSVSSQGTDSSGGMPYYILNWNDGSGRVYCKSGVTCDGAYGSHGNRAYAWYKIYIYQDRTKVTYYKFVKDTGWTTTKDNSANSVEIRFKPKQCIHNYKSSIIKPTCTSQGYTLHTCTICGDSYKDNYTNYKPTGVLMGDINNDGKITTADVGLANAHAKGTKQLSGEALKKADVNKDGKVSTADVGLINAYAKGTKKYS